MRKPAVTQTSSGRDCGLTAAGYHEDVKPLSIDDPLPPALPFTVLHAGRRLLIRCTGELSAATLAGLESLFSRSLTSRLVVLDLSGVSFADSEGLRWLLRLDASLRARRQDLRVLVRQGSSLQRALSLTGYDRLVDLHHSGRSAWSALAPT